MTSNSISITDINLSALLLAMGAPIAKKAQTIITPRGNRHVYHFTDTPETRSIIKAWQDPDFVTNNPTDPISFVKATFDCRRELLARTDDYQKIAHIPSSDGSRLAIIPENATDDEKKELLGRLN